MHAYHACACDVRRALHLGDVYTLKQQASCLLQCRAIPFGPFMQELYFFGYILTCYPGQSAFGQPRKSIQLGHTLRTVEEQSVASFQGIGANSRAV